MAWDIIPAGGWHYFENDGTKIEGNSHSELIANVTSYRTHNNLPLGNPEADVDKQVCARQPAVCGIGRVEDDDAPKKVYGQPIKRRLVDRVATWLGNRYAKLGSIQTVSKEEAERRTSICVSCEKNQKDWRAQVTRDCAPCGDRIEVLDTLSFKIRKGNQVTREKNLGACQHYGMELQTAVWMPEQAMQMRKHYPNAPSNCWLAQMEEAK